MPFRGRAARANKARAVGEGCPSLAADKTCDERACQAGRRCGPRQRGPRLFGSAGRPSALPGVTRHRRRSRKSSSSSSSEVVVILLEVFEEARRLPPPLLPLLLPRRRRGSSSSSSSSSSRSKSPSSMSSSSSSSSMRSSSSTSSPASATSSPSSSPPSKAGPSDFLVSFRRRPFRTHLFRIPLFQSRRSLRPTRHSRRTCLPTFRRFLFLRVSCLPRTCRRPSSRNHSPTRRPAHPPTARCLVRAPRHRRFQIPTIHGGRFRDGARPDATARRAVRRSWTRVGMSWLHHRMRMWAD